MVATPFQTSSPAQMVGQYGYEVTPLLTIGETVEGPSGDYTPPGIPDGMGAFSLDDDTVRLLVNHELNADDGYLYTLNAGTPDEFQVSGTRISYIDINKSTLEVEDAGLAYERVFDVEDNLVTDNSQLPNVADPDGTNHGFARFCSGQYFEAGTFGLVDDIYISGEEIDNGLGVVLDVNNNELHLTPYLGRGGWENATFLDTGTDNFTAVAWTDDSPGSFTYLWVGEKDTSDGASFLDRNGLGEDGNLYVWVPDSGNLVDSNPNGPDYEVASAPIENGGLSGDDLVVSGEVDIRDRIADDSYGSGSWEQLTVFDAAQAGQTGYDEFGFALEGTLRQEAGDLGATAWSRPEDIDVNPNNGTEFVIANTGRSTFAPIDGADLDGDGNPDPVSFDYVGDIMVGNIDFSSLQGLTSFTDIPNGSITTEFTLAYDGDADPDRTLRSPDNLDWAEDGFIYVQEDRAADGLWGSGEQGNDRITGEPPANRGESRIVRIDPTNGDPGDGGAIPVAVIDRSAVPEGQIDTDPTDIGDWESSGILDVSSLFGEEPGQLLLFNVQAHSLGGGEIGDPNVDSSDPTSDDSNLVQGGQIAFLSPGVVAPTIGETTALIPQAGSSNLPEHLRDGESGDIDFPFGDFKPLATVGEVDPDTGDAMTGYPDGQAAWLADEDTVRVAYQSESYATLSSSAGETYPWVMESGVEFTGSHIHTIDYNRAAFAEFLDNDTAASEMFEGSGHLFDTVYNVFGEVVTGKNTDPNDLGAKWGNQVLADGTVVEFDSDQLLTQGDWFFHSFCGAYYEQANKYGEGIGFEDDIFTMSEEWNIGELFDEAAAGAGITEDNARLSPGEDFALTTMGLASMVVDVENEVAYTVPALGQSGYEKILPINPGSENYVVLVMAGYNMEVEPQPMTIYVGRKGVDANGDPLTEDASERDSFLGRNGLLYGQLYGMALDGDTYANLGIETVDVDTFMMDDYAKDADAPENFSARYYPTSYQWEGFDNPVNVNETEMLLWEQDGDNGEPNEQPGGGVEAGGFTYFSGDSKTEHPAVDPDPTKHRFVQNLTVPSAQLGVEFSDILNELEGNDEDGNGLPDYLSVDVTRILAGADGELTLETGGKGAGHIGEENPDGTLTHAIHIEDGEARMDQPDGLQWIKAADGDFLIVDEDSGNDAGERKYVLPIDGETLNLVEEGTGYFLASAGGNDNPRVGAQVEVIEGSFSPDRSKSSEFSGTWNVTHLVATKEDGSFYTQEEIAGMGAQEIIGSVPLAEQTLIGVVQHRAASGGVVEENLADQGGQVFMFNIELPETPVGFYNDLASHIPGQYDGTNITDISLGETGNLINFATGDTPGYTLTVTGDGTSANVSGTTENGTLPDAGTDGFEIFEPSGVDLTRYIQGDSGAGFVDLTFGNLDSEVAYEISVIAERSADDVRDTQFSILGADSFTNTSSDGTTFEGASDASVIYNANNIATGYVAQFSNVEPGVDGEFTIRVDNGGDGNWYVNAIALQEEAAEPEAAAPAFGSLGDDTLEGGLNLDFEGVGNPVFAGEGSDTVDTSTGSGGNRLYGGSNNDELVVGSNDRAFGGTGDDIIESSLGRENRLYGGMGNDTIIAGYEDRVIGSEGDDRFFLSEGEVEGGGKNLVTGGEGIDQFWIANAQIAENANTITDFTPGEDVLGIGGIDGIATFADLSIGSNDNGDAVVGIGSDDLAILLGVEAGELGEGNFAIQPVAEIA